MLPASIWRLYRLSRLVGFWPIVRGMRLRWLAWAARQMHITDLRQQEILLERFALERLP
jgi:hypothetical protein